MPFTPTYFDPAPRGQTLSPGRVLYAHPGPDEPGARYVYDRALVLAVNVALATQRPLLLAGEPGCGKTSVARNVALHQGWAWYPHTMASRSQADELLFQYDALARLNEAQARHRLRDESHFVQPGVLWWALAPESAARRGLAAPAAGRGGAVARTRGAGRTPPPQPPAGHRATGGAVVLIDEIDKCEPDVPNDLLEVLDARRFSVQGRPVVAEAGARPHVLVVITTNAERDLPGAFVRRCVTHRFPEAPAGWFADIAQQRWPGLARATLDQLEQRLRAHRDQARQRDERLPGTAEYLDAVAAVARLQVAAAPAPEGAPAPATADPSAGQAPPFNAAHQLELLLFSKQAALGGGPGA